MPVTSDNPHAARLKALRAAMSVRSLTYFIVPKADAFQNETVPAWDDGLTWLTGFTGSAGTAIIGQDDAVLLTDSRYSLQAKAQTDPDLFSVEQAPPLTLAEKLSALKKPGARVGYDPRLHTMAGFKAFEPSAHEFDMVEFVPCAPSPLDEIWDERPAAASRPIVRHPDAFAGETSASKLERIRADTRAKDCDGLLISAPDAAAWLFNIRGGDLAHTPIPLVRAFVPIEGMPSLFLQPGHLTPDNEAWIRVFATPHPLDPGNSLPALFDHGAKVLVDPGQTTLAVSDAFQNAGAVLVEGQDPCKLRKARKNSIELQGARNAHRRDGVALCRFLCWLDENALPGSLDESDAAQKLEDFRRMSGLFRSPSFDTIAGAGPNGAIVHYRVTAATNRRLEASSLFLIDSGAQYEDGTTDVTRTVAIGTPSAVMRKHFTLVLKGHIAVAIAKFPAGTRGIDLDPFARRALWAAGLDYGHGTGHGVGSYLAVHEGPQSISRQGMAVLEPGMILSNEPGYYREDQYGIRIENLMAVTEAATVEGGDRAIMGFETLTLAPFDRRLIETAMLSPVEVDWIDAYHARVCDELSQELGPREAEWLAAATAPLER